jgi:hypothetical protein
MSDARAALFDSDDLDTLEQTVDVANRAARLTRLMVAGLLAENSEKVDADDVRLALECVDLLWCRTVEADSMLRRARAAKEA